MDNMSRVLVEKETIYTEEVAMLMKGASYKEVIAYMDEREGMHQSDPFRTATTPAKEHIVQEAVPMDETNEEQKDEKTED